MEQNQKVTLITGASSGIGKAMAKIFAKNGHDLILVARREERLKELKNEVEQKYKVNAFVICSDLSEVNQPFQN